MERHESQNRYGFLRMPGRLPETKGLHLAGLSSPPLVGGDKGEVAGRLKQRVRLPG